MKATTVYSWTHGGQTHYNHLHVIFTLERNCGDVFRVTSVSEVQPPWLFCQHDIIRRRNISWRRRLRRSSDSTRLKPFQTQLLRQSTDDNDGGDGGSCEEFGDNPEKNTSVGWRLEGEDKGTGGCLSVATM